MPFVNVTLLLSMLLMENRHHTRTLIQPNVFHTLMAVNTLIPENAARMQMGTFHGTIRCITNAAVAPLYHMDRANFFTIYNVIYTM